MRITNNMMSTRSLADLVAQMEAVAHAQQQVDSGRRIVQPSDDPAGTRTAIRLRDALGQTNQYLRNIDTADTRMSAAEASLSGASDVLQRARELAVQGANGTLSAANRSAMALEVEQLARALVHQANAKSGDDYVFSGFRTDVAPFIEAPPGSAVASLYQGDAGLMQARIGPGETVATNLLGDAAFKPALDALAALHADLIGGGLVAGATISAVDAGSRAIIDAWADLGARQNRLSRTQQSLGDVLLATQKLLSNTEDVDFAAAVTELTSRQTAYEAALKTSGRILQTSLLDTLR